MHLSTTHHLKIMQQYKIRWKVFLPLRPASWFLIIFLIKSILDKSTDYELILILSEANMQLSIKFIKKQNNNTKYKFIFKIGNIIIVIKKKKKSHNNDYGFVICFLQTSLLNILFYFKNTWLQVRNSCVCFTRAKIETCNSWTHWILRSYDYLPLWSYDFHKSFHSSH